MLCGLNEGNELRNIGIRGSADSDRNTVLDRRHIEGAEREECGQDAPAAGRRIPQVGQFDSKLSSEAGAPSRARQCASV